MTANTEQIDYITLPDAEIRYSLSESTLRRRHKEGQIKLCKPGGRTLVKVSEMEKLMEDSQV